MAGAGGWLTCAVVAEHDGGQQQERLLAGQEVVGVQLPRHLPRLPRLHVLDALLQQAGGLLPPARPGGPQHAQQAVPGQVQVQVQETGAGDRHVAAADLVPGSSSFRTL